MPFAARPVVTGLGPVCSAGFGRGPFWETLLDPDVKPAPMYDPAAAGLPLPPMPLYRPDGDQVESWLQGESLSALPPDTELRLSAVAASLAIKDAGLNHELASAALVATCEAPGMDRFLRGIFEDFSTALGADGGSALDSSAVFQRFYQRHKEAAYSTQSFLYLHVLARALRIHGHTLFVNNACASGLYALDAAAALVETGKAPLAIVVGAESPSFPSKQLWFSEGGLHSRDGLLRPFDRDRTGLILGEGAAAIVLESWDHAHERGAKIYGEYLGGHFNQEGWKVTIPNFAECFHEDVLRGACAAASVNPEEIQGLIAHGAGTGLSDAYEARGITSVFGDWPQRPAITALKGYSGHTLGACALIEVVALLLAFEKETLPACAGFSTPNPKLKLEPLTRPLEQRWDLLMKVSNGFAGFNAATVFRRI
jgi:3-oxoacyl-[acyl-carrier-protein] synthase II